MCNVVHLLKPFVQYVQYVQYMNFFKFGTILCNILVCKFSEIILIFINTSAASFPFPGYLYPPVTLKLQPWP